MRCQSLVKSVGYGASRCPRAAAPGFRECTRCQRRRLRKERNAIDTALGKEGKNVGWRDPELRDYVRSLKCCLADHPLHRCEPVFERRKIEANHVDPKAHAGDHDNLYPGCPSLSDEAEGRGARKRAEKKYGVSFKEIARQVTSGFMASKGLTV